MSDNQQFRASCGNNNPCFRIFTGRRIASGNPPNDSQVCHVLRCSDNALFRKNGSTWSRVTVPANAKFVFYDVSNESICLIGFENMGQITPEPVMPRPGNGGGVVGPIVSAITPSTRPFTTTTGNNFDDSRPTFTTGPVRAGTFTATQGGTVTSTNSLTVTNVPTGTPLATPAAVAAGPGSTVVGEGITNGANFILAVASDNSAVITAAGEQGEVNGSIAQGRLAGNSRAIISDNGAYAQFVAVNSSIVHSDQDGGHAGGVAADCSLLHSAAPSSMARGTASDRSQIRTGGMPVVTNLPSSSRFTVAQVGFGVVTDNTVQAITFDTSNGCADRSVFVNDESLRLRPPLGFFNRKQTLGSIGLENAAGVGHGALASGLSVDQSHLLATANGSFAVGQAQCGEVHMAAGLASAVLGRCNRALGAYSQGFGHNALAYMHAQSAQAIPTTINDDVDEDANRIQYNQVPLRGFTTAERTNFNEDRTAFEAFELTTILVLGDTPDNALIDIENGPTLDYRRVPFLPVNGSAMVEADVISPLLQTEDRRYTLPAFCGKFCFCVSRTGSDHQFSYEVQPTTEDGDPSIGSICTIPDPARAGLTIVAEEFDGQSDGFTVKITEIVPTTVEIGGRVRPNPRIDPKPPTSIPITSRENYYIQGRIWGGHFRYTEVPEGSSEVRYESPVFNERVYTVYQPAFNTVNAANLTAAAQAGTGARDTNQSKGGSAGRLETELGDEFQTKSTTFSSDAVAGLTGTSGLGSFLNPGFGTTTNFGTDGTNTFNAPDFLNPTLNTNAGAFTSTTNIQDLNNLASPPITTPNF